MIHRLDYFGLQLCSYDAQFLLQVQTEKITSSILRDEELSVCHPPTTRSNRYLDRPQKANRLLIIVDIQGVDRVPGDIAKLYRWTSLRE